VRSAVLHRVLGRLLFQKDTRTEFGQGSPLYGVALSPLVEGSSVIVHVGGPGKGALTAFDAATGAVRWAWRGDGPAYASPVVATIGGVRQVVTFSESFLVGVSADRGELLWKIPFTTPWVQNAVTPIVDGDRVVYSGLEQPVRALRVVRGATGWTTQPLWESPDVARMTHRCWRRPYGLPPRRGCSSPDRTGGRWPRRAAARTRAWLRGGCTRHHGGGSPPSARAPPAGSAFVSPRVHLAHPS
jgi:hypothetical protein